MGRAFQATGTESGKALSGDRLTVLEESGKGTTYAGGKPEAERQACECLRSWCSARIFLTSTGAAWRIVRKRPIAPGADVPFRSVPWKVSQHLRV